MTMNPDDYKCPVCHGLIVDMVYEGYTCEACNDTGFDREKMDRDGVLGFVGPLD